MFNASELISAGWKPVTEFTSIGHPISTPIPDYVEVAVLAWKGWALDVTPVQVDGEWGIQSIIDGRAYVLKPSAL